MGHNLRVTWETHCTTFLYLDYRLLSLSIKNQEPEDGSFKTLKKHAFKMSVLDSSTAGKIQLKRGIHLLSTGRDVNLVVQN